jgi:hypothetical protein
MSIQYEVDRVRRLVRAVSTGRIDQQVVRDYLRRLQDDPAYSDDLDAIIDLREASSDFNLEDVRDIAELVRRRPKEAISKRAVIVSSDEHFGMMRMFEAYTSKGPTRYRVFRDMEEAQAWIASDEQGE